MDSILITGGTGFLGSKIYKQYSSNNNIFSLGRSSRNDIVCDLSKKVPKFLNCIFDTVIHCAGKAHTNPKNNRDIQEFIKINFIGTKNLLKAIDLLPVLPKSFLFISSVAVYGADEGNFIDEQHEIRPKTPYGITKKLAEDYIIEWGKKNNIKVCILRLPLIIGRDPVGNLKLMMDGIKNGKYLNIDRGKARRSMVLANDIITFIPVLIKNEGIYNLTDGYHPSFFELSELIVKKFNRKTIFNISKNHATIVAKIGDLIHFFVRKEMPFNSLKLRKMTSSLTFDDTKARRIGWKPHGVLSKPHWWLD